MTSPRKAQDHAQFRIPFAPSKQETAVSEMAVGGAGENLWRRRDAPCGNCGTDGFGQVGPGWFGLVQIGSDWFRLVSGTPRATFGGHVGEGMRADEGAVQLPGERSEDRKGRRTGPGREAEVERGRLPSIRRACHQGSYRLGRLLGGMRSEGLGPDDIAPGAGLNSCRCQ